MCEVHIPFPFQESAMTLNPPSTKRSGFTLVELLVVIGIIALLISILLPSLTRARQYANMIKCQSNLRQIGMALHLYAAENDNSAPWSSSPWQRGVLPDGTSGGDYYARWPETLSGMLGDEGLTETYGMTGTMRQPISPVFQDTDTVPGGVRHYTANVRVMGDSQNIDAYRRDVLGRSTASVPLGQARAAAFHPARLASLSPATEIAAAWCGNQTNLAATPPGTHPVHIGAAPTDSRQLDHTASNTVAKGYLIRDLMTPELLQQRTTPGLEYKLDRAGAPGPSTGIRTRHMNNTATNFLFVDGHVESRIEPEFLLQIFAVPAPK